MPGHRHNPNADTQNQGNALGDRACVRMSKLYRQHEGGNSMKALLGASHLSWDAEQQQGAYAGKPVYDHLRHELTGPEAGTGRSVAFQRHQRAQQDSYSKSSWETTSSGYGFGRDENSYPNAPYQQPPRAAPQGAKKEVQRRSYGNDSSGIAGAFSYEGEEEVPVKNSAAAYRAMKEQFNYDDAQDYSRRQGERGGDNNYSYAVATTNRRNSFGQDSRSTRPW